MFPRTFILMSFLAAFMLQGALAEPEPDRNGQPLLYAVKEAALTPSANNQATTEQAASEYVDRPDSAIYSPFADAPKQKAPLDAAVAPSGNPEAPDFVFTWLAMVGSVAGLGCLFRAWV